MGGEVVSVGAGAIDQHGFASAQGREARDGEAGEATMPTSGLAGVGAALLNDVATPARSMALAEAAARGAPKARIPRWLARHEQLGQAGLARKRTAPSCKPT